MKKLGEILCIPAILLAGNCFSQQVIATAGSTGSGTGIELSWTIGEPVTATAPGSGFILTQGFQQGQPEVQTDNQQISLSEGWNVVSSRVIPENRNLMDVLQSLISDGYLKKVMNEEGKTLEDWGVYGGWQNGIGDLRSTEGYNINVKSPANLLIDGSTYIFPFFIHLTTGWNIVSWPSPNQQEGMEVLNALISGGKLIKVMDEAGKTIEDWGIFGGWKNNIGNLKPGEGYKVKVNGDCTLIINETGTKSEVVTPAPLASVHFIPAFKGNGTEHMNIHLVSLAESGIKAGDEIGIFDGSLCVGSAKVGIQSSTVSIPVSANDGLEGKNGFTVGNKIEMRLFRKGMETELYLIPVNGENTNFKKGATLFAKAGMSTGFDEQEAMFNVKCYPVPFSNELFIEFTQPVNAKTKIRINDITGRKIREFDQAFTDGYNLVRWDGTDQNGAKVVSGFYFINVENENYNRIIKVTKTEIKI